MSTALVLFGHGARDPRWREPFDRLAAMVAARHNGPVSLAFLELMHPSLDDACRDVVRCGAQRVQVVPLFLGTGGHIRRDLPMLLDAASRSCGVAVTSVTPAGEDDGVIAALAAYCLRCADAAGPAG